MKGSSLGLSGPSPVATNAASATTGGNPLPGRYALNLFSIAFFGVLASAWVLYYTDSFEIVGGLLALGGAFSWLAFLSKAMPDERLKAVQAWIEDHVLMKRWLWLFPLGLIVAGMTVTSFLGTVQVEALTTGGAVLIGASGKTEPGAREWLPIAQGQHIRELVWTRPGAPSDVSVKFVGYPSRTVKIHSWQRLNMQGPDSFQRPVIVLRPTLTLMQSRVNSPVFLVVRYGGIEQSVEFSGQTILIGSDPEIEMPQSLIESWRAEVLPQGTQTVPERWVHPTVLEGTGGELREGENIEIELHSKGEKNTIGPVWACSQVYQVRHTSRESDFVQQGVFDVQNSSNRKCGTGTRQEVVLLPQ